MSYHVQHPNRLSGYSSSTVPGQIVSSSVNDDPSMQADLRSTDPIEASMLVRRTLDSAALEVTNAEAALGRAAQRAAIPATLQSTRLWLRQKLEDLRSYVSSTPAVDAMDEVQTQSTQIIDSASALKALADRIGA